MLRKMHRLSYVAASLAVLVACENEAGLMTDRSRAPGLVEPTVARFAATTDKVSYEQPVQDRESYAPIESNPIQRVTESPVSTFSIDVDTAAYANVRRFIEAGQMPPRDAVRVEELINYFSYDYPIPTDPERPFSVTTELAPTPWNPRTHLLHVGLKGYELERAERAPANLVFLVDVSGSMQSQDKLPLVKRSLQLLTRELGPDDRVAIAVYAGAAGVVLEPTAGDDKRTIKAALDKLEAGGSTAGGAGIRLAYALAEENFDPEAINRVILATDGDFNVGVTNPQRLQDLIAKKRDSGIALSVLGFGTGNYNDDLMERLSNHGNGNAAYIDNLNEARKVLVDELNSTLMIIAKDVKIQIEFNPAVVAEYRLIGYENRLLRRQDFTDDRVDAGDIGAGHSVTALYEIAFTDGGGTQIPDLRYQTTTVPADTNSDEIAFLKLRYKAPESNTSRPIEQAIMRDEVLESIDATSKNFRFAAAVAAFGQLLRGGALMSDYELADAIQLARDARGEDGFGYRSDFVQLARLAESLR